MEIEDRIAMALQRSGNSIMYTSVTDTIAFALGALSTIPAIKYFCSYAAMSVFVDFLFQGGCFPLHPAQCYTGPHHIFIQPISSYCHLAIISIVLVTLFVAVLSLDARRTAARRRYVDRFTAPNCVTIPLSPGSFFSLILSPQGLLLLLRLAVTMPKR